MPYKQPPKEHQFKKGESGNIKGRPKDSIKVYLRRTLGEMTDKEKQKWIKQIPKELQWRMAEGNPSNETELTGKEGEPIKIELSERIAKKLYDTSQDTKPSSREQK